MVIFMQQVKINTEYITLGQLLKIVDIASSGGEAKILVKELTILVDGMPEDRRGRKLYPKMIIKIKNHGEYQIIWFQKSR